LKPEDIRANLELRSEKMYSQVWRDQAWLGFVDFTYRVQIKALEMGIFTMPPAFPVPLPVKANLNYRSIYD